MIIDLSKYNVVTDWNKVKANVDGIILRCGYRGYGSGKIVIDGDFLNKVQNCVKYKIPFGLYFMSQAITETEGKEEADFCIKYAKQYGATLPIFIDSEDGDGTAKVVRADGLSATVRTKVVAKFCETVKNAGYETGVYASTSWFNSKLDVTKLLQYKTWVAQYSQTNTAKFRVDLWQYTSSGTVPGINGRVDMSKVMGSSTKSNPYPVPTRTLKVASPMMNGNDVKWVQYELCYRGYIKQSDIDGWYGNITKNAVMAFQANASNLVVDGIVGKMTIAEMQK